MDRKHDIPEIPVTKGLVFVSGSWHQMGVQYGKQAKDAVRIKCASGIANAVEYWRRKGTALEAVQEYQKLLEEKAPQISMLWHGIAEGAGLDFTDIGLAYMDFRKTDMRCSNISAWGQAAAGQKTYCGMNCDEKELVNYYAPTVIAYPDCGYPFISASGFTCNCVFNTQGLVLMASCGQNAMPEDVGVGLPNCISLILCAVSCKNAEAAKEKILAERLGPGGGENIHIADKGGKAFVIEHTAARDMVRMAGDNGEKDYLLATNHFMIPQMESSNFFGQKHEQWMNSYFRYWSEEQVLVENYGKIDLELLNNALGNRRFFAKDLSVLGKKRWKVPEAVRSGWNDLWGGGSQLAARHTGKFSPEIRTANAKCVFSALIYPERLEFYLLNGCRDKTMSMNPWATGVFTKTIMAHSAREVTESVWEEAARRIYEVSCMNDMGDSLKEAKLAYAEGIYWRNLAICEEDCEGDLELWSHSSSAFLKAQQYAFLNIGEGKCNGF